MEPTPNKQVIFLKTLDIGYPVVGEHIAVQESSIDLNAPIEQDEFILKTLTISIDPFIRNPMKTPSTKKSAAPIAYYSIGSPIYGFTASRVIRSRNTKFNEGDIVTGVTYLEEYTLISPKTNPFASWLTVRNEIKESGFPLSYHLSVMGMPGFTAHAGLFEIGKPKKGETLFVSAASGAVGQLVGQIAKLQGLYTIGSAGTDEKVAYLKEIGFDAAFNYKTTPDIAEKLAELAPQGIDIYFDNVGGEILEAALESANRFARFICCGMISIYNTENQVGIRNVFQIVGKHITMEGFMVQDYGHLEGAFIKEMKQWLNEGKIKYRETIVEGFDQTAQAILDVQYGKNFGKQLVKVADF
ncbi:hypothetical protein BDA99DRAFT_549008 [Phascolomyces articulosus]|uniref:Enoyl reductase (ER) domain-containing protein n=1 Tax=Phascolomyces articulosus TaxID=60185 RepID=A0AAD5P8B8_9FUNG|nr:hypothetical protein BDA99DRAFT_549008 [Phascolomyces articulosus]